MTATKAEIQRLLAEAAARGRPEGDLVGVTTMLSKTKPAEDQAQLDAWRARVGDAEADRILAESHQIGNSLDRMLQHHMEGCLDLEEAKSEIAWPLYRQLQIHLKTMDPIATQAKLYSVPLGLVGKPDLIAYHKGELAIVDFKNSKRRKPPRFLEDYFLQCCAYAMMLYETTGFAPKKIILPIALREETSPQIEVRRVKDYVGKVLERVAQYRGLVG